MPSAITFRKAVKYDARGRVALIGPGGSGKSFTALTLARLLAGSAGNIAAIDTEHGSLSKYGDLFDFDVMELDSYTPENFLGALTAAEENKYDVFLCDSLSHFWMGKNGALEFVDERKKRTASRGGDQMEGWKDWRPHERAMIDRMIASPCHVIVTMRTKNEYKEEPYINSRGEQKTKRVKVGLAPVQREGLEYEFDLVGLMTDENDLIIDKTRCPEYAGKVLSKPGETDFVPFRNWLKGAKREPAPEVSTDPVQSDNGTAPTWDWRVVLPAFDRIEQKVGHTRFVAMLGANGYTKLEEVPTRENFVLLYKSLQAEIELTGVTSPTVAAEPSVASVLPNGTHLNQPSTATTETMPPELAAMWKRIQSIPTACSVFCDLKKQLIDVVGMDRAEELYQTTLGLHGVVQSNQFRNLGTARQCASRLWQQIQTLKHLAVPNPDISDEDVPFGNGEGRAA